MDRKKQLVKEIAERRKELSEIEEKEIQEEHYPRLEKQVGTCWKYRENSYGSGSGKWDMFKKVLEFYYDKEGLLHYVVEEFSTDCNGRSVLAVESHFPYPEKRESPFHDHWEPISHEEYAQNRLKLLNEMQTHAAILAPKKK